MMKPMKEKWPLLLWLVVPVLAGSVYPYVKEEPGNLQWVTISMVIYVLFFSVVLHEWSHGMAARLCGDLTAQQAGRLTWNPIRHVSFLGSFLLPLVLYLMRAPAVVGWAKPVPFRPAGLRQYPRDQVFLAVAGPLSNFALSYLCFTLFLIAGSVFNFLFKASPVKMQLDLFAPIPLHSVPLEPFWFVLFQILSLGMVVNLVLGVFNLIPFPPLDGSWILRALLPKKAMAFFSRAQFYGFIVLILALQFGLLEWLFYPVGVILVVFLQWGNLCLR